MGRHSRDSEGEDQQGVRYRISYAPDWLYVAKVTRDLDSGRQSTKTLVRNPDAPIDARSTRPRAHLRSEALDLDVEISVQDARGVVRRIIIETEPGENGEIIAFSLSCRARPDGPD